MIPKQIHFIWVGCALPMWVETNIHRWQELNPDYGVHLHGEEVLVDEYRDLYARVTDNCSKSDLLRLSVLRVHGGWYFDTDFVPLRPLDDVYADYKLEGDLFLTKQWEKAQDGKHVANGIIGITKDSGAWDEIDGLVVRQCAKPLVRTSFGPTMTTMLAHGYPSVVLAAVKDFYYIRFNPRGLAREAYKDLVGTDFSEVMQREIFGVHHPYAFHMWCGGKYGEEL